jgi:hypothetical protein
MLATVAFLAACSARMPPPAVAPPTEPADFPEAFYRDAQARGEPVLRIDPSRSQATLRVYRDGRFARFGHDHIVASRDIRGYVLLPTDIAQARADLYVPLASLSVDEPGLRAQAGLDTTPSSGDIEGTRRNMLDRTLEAERYPFAVLHLSYGAGPRETPVLNAVVRLHGMTRDQEVSVTLDTSGGELRVTGRFVLTQTGFGMTPYSILGGALQVRDGVDVEFDLVARR